MVLLKGLPILTIFYGALAASEPLPVVLWHGMGDTCCFPFSMGSIKKLIETEINGTYVLSLRIGGNIALDYESGFFLDPDDQVRYVCDQLSKDKQLAGGYHAIGFSQGGQFVWIQRELVQATYWHDPLHEEEYRQKCSFLSNINNEVFINQTYIDNLNKLEKFVMVMFLNDTIVQPRESQWFGFYAPGQDTAIRPLTQSGIYEDLGLDKMDHDGKLLRLSVEGDHLQMTSTWFIENIIPLLKKN